MIRRLTSNEKSVNPEHEYVFERNGYKTWLTEKKFQQLAKEVLELLETESTFCKCENPSVSSVTEDFNFQICDTCGHTVI